MLSGYSTRIIFRSAANRSFFLKRVISRSVDIKPSTHLRGSKMKYISQDKAIKIDEQLMDSSSSSSYTLSQLMELAGLACATALERCYPQDRFGRVIVICGPGNQGGDGLVAARHLSIWGYTVLLYVPKPSKNEYLARLLGQCQELESIRLIESEKEFVEAYQIGKVDVCMDAIFGFSFHPPVRPPFDTILIHLSQNSPAIPIISIDIPSGWSVESSSDTGPQRLENTEGKEIPRLDPQALLSLTAPKEGVRTFQGRHFLGGRFVPPDVAKKFELDLPEYPGAEQIVEITGDR